MRRDGMHELFKRSVGNPILTADQWPYPANAVFNAAATLVDGKTLLLVRVEDLRGMSHLTVARSDDGLTGWKVDEKPAMVPEVETHPEECFGVEDPRITWIEELSRYFICYTAYGEDGPQVSIASTKDFVHFERLGVAMFPDNKDAALFPRRIGGRWALLHRPMAGAFSSGAHVWISYSPDMKYWGDHQVVVRARSRGWWDAGKIGLNAPPLETGEGWLIIYHGVRVTGAGVLYRCGLALLDLEDPGKVIRRTDGWVFGPRQDYERIGDVGNVVFPCGWTQVGDEVRLYYGAADQCMGVATAKVADLLHFMRKV